MHGVTLAADIEIFHLRGPLYIVLCSTLKRSLRVKSHYSGLKNTLVLHFSTTFSSIQFVLKSTLLEMIAPWDSC